MLGKSRFSSLLAMIWIALLAIWAIWEYSHYSGLYRWLAEWQVFSAALLRGVLVENGLPADVVAAFAAQGVKLASPHYLLTTDSAGGRANYYIAAALAGLIGVSTLLMALILSARIARASRRTDG